MTISSAHHTQALSNWLNIPSKLLQPRNPIIVIFPLNYTVAKFNAGIK